VDECRRFRFKTSRDVRYILNGGRKATVESESIRQEKRERQKGKGGGGIKIFLAGGAFEGKKKARL